MSRLQGFLPRGMPLWAALFGNTCLATVVFSILILLLPSSLISKNKIIWRVRQYLRKSFKRIIFLSTQGPFYRLFVWCGKRGACGRLASRCKAPSPIKARPSGCNEVSITIAENVPLNPFHEESYVLSWRPANCGKDMPWREKVFDRHNDCEEVGKRLRLSVDGLPENSALCFRSCAVNRWGRSEWTDEVSVATLARPNDDGGLSGPAGPAAASLGNGRDTYQWTQNRTEVNFKVPIGGDWKAKELKVKVTPHRLEIMHMNGKLDSEPGKQQEQELLVGTFPKKIKADEIFWEIETDKEMGRHLAVQLMKAEKMEKWPCLIEAEGHSHIDTRLVRLFAEGIGPGTGLDIME